MRAAVQDKQRAAVRLLPSLKGATGPLTGLIVLCLFLTFATDKFLSVRNFLNVLDQITVLGVMAVGMTFVILIGGIDLAVGSVMALAMMVLGYLHVVAGVPMWLAIPLALAAASLNGLIAGLLITRFNVPAFIATLAMMSITRGLANMVTDGQQIIGFPAWFNMMAIVRFGGFLTLTVAVMIVVFIVGLLYQRYRHGGRVLYAVGGMPKWRALPVSTFSARPCSSMSSAASSRVFPAWCLRLVWTRSSRRRACPMSSTPSRRSSSAVLHFPAERGGSAAPSSACSSSVSCETV